jgi:acyl-coenzyme A synthetase/AMP-(fatty) acid ligase
MPTCWRSPASAASLGELTQRVLALPGVEDAVVFQSDRADAGGVRRIAALVVAPGRDAAALLAELRGAVDPVFLPRPLKCVTRLPRNATGKLPREALLALLEDDRATR